MEAGEILVGLMIQAAHWLYDASGGMNGVFAAETLRTLRKWAITQKRERELQQETSDLIRTFGETILI
jgi:hypothetical protein